jgi:hypothetical protein
MAGWRICQVSIMPELPAAAEVALDASQIKISAQARVMHPGKVQENADVAAATVNDSDFIVD